MLLVYLLLLLVVVVVAVVVFNFTGQSLINYIYYRQTKNILMLLKGQ
jgi:hypothetical protein